MPDSKDYSKLGLNTGPADVDCLKEMAKLLDRMKDLTAWQRDRYRMLDYKPTVYYQYRTTTSHLRTVEELVKQASEELQDLVQDDQILTKQIYGAA